MMSQVPIGKLKTKPVLKEKDGWVLVTVVSKCSVQQVWCDFVSDWLTVSFMSSQATINDDDMLLISIFLLLSIAQESINNNKYSHSPRLLVVVV